MRDIKQFSKYNSIPKYCFECYKVVIESKNFYDLLKMSLIFDQLTYFQKFNRKNMIDKKSETDIFKSIIYCTSLDEVFDVENKTKQILIFILMINFYCKQKRLS